jgi:hypothetical protein
MAAKHDQSQTAQTTSTVNETSEATATLSDSFNQTTNYVTNLSTTQGGGDLSPKSLALMGGVALFALLLFAIKR